MDAPRSDKFRQMEAASSGAAASAVKASIEGRRRSWLERIFEFAGKKYRVVALGEQKIKVDDTLN